MPTQMMDCGHAANAVMADGKPCCAICTAIGNDPLRGTRPKEAPGLAGRTAYCTYRGCRSTWERRRDTHYGEFGADGRSFAPSSTDLPFFRHTPDKPSDEYFCGCWGWD